MPKIQNSIRDLGTSNLRERLLAGLPVTERRLQLNGIATAVLEGGDGPPVILIHGPAEYGARWWSAIAELVKTHRVIVPDLPGHGATDSPAVPFDHNRVLGWLDDLIDCTCPTRPVLVGQVLGGAIAARLACDRSDRLSGLVLVNALGLAEFQPPPDFGLALTDYLSAPTEETHDHLWNQCAFDYDTMRRRIGVRWDWIKAYNVDRARTPALQATLPILMDQFGLRAIPPADLSRISVPTSLIWGRHHRPTPLSVAEAASARYGWPLHVIENVGDPEVEQPHAFVEVLRAALDDSGPRKGDAPINPVDTRAAWDRIAPAYDRTNTPTQMRLGSEGLKRAGLRKGMRFLDVASGSGSLSIPAARLGAQVLAIDQSPVMLDLLKARAHKEGLEIETRVMDGQALQLPDNAFDVVGSQFGVMLFPDMPRGIREMARVAKPGGRVLVHAYSDPHRIDFLGFFIDAVQSVRPDFNGPPADHPPLEFQLADPEKLRSTLAAAGLKSVTVETIIETTEFKNGEALWDWVVWSNPLVETMLRMLDLTSEDTGVIKQTLEQLVRERAGGSGAARLTNPINVGIGMK
jgi:ubiquinone/menaquinone biosynthesis C-methylase UbiE/pimeloyl-ACP methyl ester carboxylesterase